ncbi:sugar transferase [Halostagnicola sp. A-GB9-2]|uniref:sugar transferase n=1 Tax=Halostagnicola sp. A-GB9-2 TaxID=3048066 RepID=UPI0024C0D0F1|nr:sugar transferase [Halostagnicola sp. A-GB9-2]MDJ1433102.1 sugar transferase [Halostagnicola sp. A-GB9-2]
MVSRWKHGGVTAGGTVLLALVAGLVGSYLTGTPMTLITDQATAVVLIGSVVGVALAPLYVPRPRSMRTMIRRTGQQIVVACLVLASLGSVGITAAPALPTTIVVGVFLLLTLPFWYGVRQRRSSPQRVLVVGDDPSLIESVIRSLPVAPIGFLSPLQTDRAIEITHSKPSIENAPETVVATDGGLSAANRIDSISGVDRLSGLSRLEHVLKQRDIDTVTLAFSHADREECFGVLRTCRDQGVDALVHESLADQVLDGEEVGAELVRADLDPWPWYSRAAKRAFDLAFAMVGVIVLAPLILLIAVAIKVDSPGPVLYNQTRSAELGETFTLAKFRSMVTNAETDGAQLSEEDAGGVDPRVTRVGRILRKTHMDEIPQLFSILRGDMSVVGPRPERPEIDREIAADGIDWSKRWFVKPGLTGIAQVNDVTGFQPEQKLEYDLEYARHQSVRLDVKLVTLQVTSVLEDVIGLLSNRMGDGLDEDSSPK